MFSYFLGFLKESFFILKIICVCINGIFGYVDIRVGLVVCNVFLNKWRCYFVIIYFYKFLS